MKVRGYPVSDFEQSAADISVDHPEFVANYRSAHAMALKHSHGEASPRLAPGDGPVSLAVQ